MNKLSKPKSFSVSNEAIEVDFKGTICECANLLKSGIMNQTTILVAYEEKWHEINSLDLGADNSDLQAFKSFVEVMKLSLADLGIITESTKKTSVILTHDDFVSLSKKFPPHDYIQISKLNDYNVKSGGKSSIDELNDWLKVCLRDKISIDELISNRELEKSKIIMKSEKIEELEIGVDGQTAIPVEKFTPPITETADYIDTRMSQLTSLGLKFDVPSGSFNGLGYFVTQNSISDDSEEDWDTLINKITQEKIKNKVTPAVVAEIIPASENMPISSIPVKKPVSVQVFENFTPERISELVGLKEKQLEIVKANPVVKITDKTSYEKAKKTAATLLKASTAIDGKDGVDALGVRCINAFKKMFSSETGIIAKLTRDPYDEQKTIISSWENAELLREQAEQRAKLAKIKARTDELFAVPFTFNGSIYSIGTVYCLPSQIESASDEDFKVIVDNGKAIKTALDAQALIESEKDKEIEKLKAQLAAFGALSELGNTEPVSNSMGIPIRNIAAGITVNEDLTKKECFISEPATDNGSVIVNKPVGNGPTTTGIQMTDYAMPPQENVLLNRLDLEHLEHIKKPAYIKCRGYYVRGLKEVAMLIEGILNNPDVTIKKSVKITELVEILKKSV